MPAIRTFLRSLAVLALTLPVSAFAAGTITGVVTNRTDNRPAAGDDVVLIRLQQAMQESTRTKTDARGRFTLDVPDDGLHLVRVTHEKANYYQPVPPGTKSVNIDVYDAAPRVEGVVTNVVELHVETAGNELHVVEVIQVLNQSSPARTQFGPNGFDFFVPPDARIVRSGAVRDGMPVPATAAPVGDPGHYTFLFPVRPGETQFGIFYSLPYSNKLTLPMRLTGDVSTLAVVLPQGMTFDPGPGTPYSRQPGNGSVQTWVAQHVSPSQSLSFTVSGTGSLPQDNPSDSNSAQSSQQDANAGQPLPETDNKMPGRGLQNPLDPEGTRDPWAKYKWWILGGLALLLAAAAGILLRKPAAPAPVYSNPLPPSPASPQAHHVLLLQTLKEELFALETDHLQNRITESEYLEQKAALETVLRRALNRATPTATA